MPENAWKTRGKVMEMQHKDQCQVTTNGSGTPNISKHTRHTGKETHTHINEHAKEATHNKGVKEEMIINAYTKPH